MDPRQESVPGAEPSDVDATSDTRADPTGEPTRGEPGGTSGADVLTLGLFGVMVIIASVCFVIW